MTNNVVEHYLKTWPNYWDAVDRGDKPFEVRRDDRGFQRGDILVLEKWDPRTGHYLYAPLAEGGQKQILRRRITYVMSGGQLGVESGYVILGLGEE